MQNKDFELSQSELAKLSQVIGDISRSHYACNGEPVNDITITFNFLVPLWERSVQVSIAGSTVIDLRDVNLIEDDMH